MVEGVDGWEWKQEERKDSAGKGREKQERMKRREKSEVAKAAVISSWIPPLNVNRLSEPSTRGMMHRD
jgi:hypothetical protein